MERYLVHRVEALGDDDVDKASDLFVDLMKDNLGATTLAPGAALMKLLASAMFRVAVLEGEIYFVSDIHTKELVGFTMWMPPGHDLFSTPEQRNAGLLDFMQQLPGPTKDYYQAFYMKQFPEFVDQTLGPRGITDAWWLHMAMVRREHQGRGVCKALINEVQRKAQLKGERIAFTTTNDENVPKYVKMGFTHKATKMMSSHLGEWPIHVFEMLPEEGM